jgi:RimJ/RimL family protein N-acetyltransferase
MIDVHLESERLLIRQFKEGDEQDTYELNSNALVQKYTGDVMINSVDQAKQMLRTVVFKDYEKYGFGRLAVIYKPDNKLIGFTGFKYIPEVSGADLGYRFLPEYWGKGIATESSIMSLNYGFKTLKKDLFLGFALAENKASTRVLRKVGFALTKVAPYPGEEDGEVCEWYELTKERYETM